MTKKIMYYGAESIHLPEDIDLAKLRQEIKVKLTECEERASSTRTATIF